MTILIVDDNEQNLYQLQVLLTAKGYLVVTAADGAAALVKARKTPPDLIISDILMPTMDGFALCREWKKDDRLRSIPFIFYTATYNDERDREFGLSLGASRFIVKPEEPDVIIQTIQEVLNQVRHPPAAQLHPVANAPARAPIEASQQDETGYLQQYNSVLIRKLESKMQQLEQINGALEQSLDELKRTEEELRKSNQDLQQAMAQLQAMQDQMIRQERLNALGQMAAGMVHDFNNALMPIMANADYFLTHPTEPGDREALTQGLKEIMKGAEDAKNIVYRLREFYRPQDKTALLPVNLGEVIESSMDLTRPRWQKEMDTKGIAVDVRTEIPAKPVYVNGHEFELREALINLVLNAVDAMPQGGVITMRCRQEDASVIVEVSDTGTGMTPEVKKHCFEPFFSTKGTKGTGLGLAMVYGTVCRHSGTVAVESECGKGTTFRIVLASHRHSKVEKSTPVRAAS
ncbi:MAG: response regulator [Kiritimatiellae bacterium]|nr:response regulator [Kiritimatiellia bacterium]